MPRGRRLAGALAVAVAGLGALGACSSGDGSSTTTIASATTVAAGPSDGGLFPTPTAGAGGGSETDTEALPRVDLIGPAVTALEARLGSPQRFFEINATSKLVNLIIAVNDATLAQTWLYLDGQLSSKDAQPANGNTFAAAALNFDPASVLTRVHRDLPDSVLDFFYVLGGADGSVRYTVATTSSKGGQLEVTLGPDGSVKQVVDPSIAAGTPPGAPATTDVAASAATTVRGGPATTTPSVPTTTG
ncbi:MAG: hypothetical protein ABIR68_07250 [Ilumatobacteraceae bacterium]